MSLHGHLPYRRFREASLILASNKWLAEAQAQPSTPIGMLYGQWEQGDPTTRNNRSIACMGARIMVTPDRSCSASNPATPPPVEAPRSTALVPEI